MSPSRTFQLIAILCLIVVSSRDAKAIQAIPNATTATAAATGSKSPVHESKLVFHDSEGDAKRLLAELRFKRNPMAVITRAFFNPITFVVIVALLTVGALVADYILAKKLNV
jgi:hypothetical protein